MVQLAWNLSRGGTEKSTRYCTQWNPPQKWALLNRAVPCSGKAPLVHDVQFFSVTKKKQLVGLVNTVYAA